MIGNIVDLPHMLARRESRSREQQAFLNVHHSPLVSFSMNIPGPVKTNSLIRKAFILGRDSLLSRLDSVNAVIIDSLETHEDTGDELLLSVGNVPPELLKDIAVSIEDSTPVGRLYDIDIIDSSGQKLSRPNFRKCLICNKQAQECARSRSHSVSEMQSAVELLLQNLA